MRIINYISSMTTGLVLLALIGIASAIGSSILPDTFFKTIPFWLLLLLLFINMAFCTFNRFKFFLNRSAQISRNRRLLVRYLGFFTLHVGIVFILIGASLYSYLGQNGQLNILEGDTIDLHKVIHTNKPIFLKLESFTVEFNDDGSPSQYYSVLEVSEPGKSAVTEVISVNYPLKYEGIKAYQSSYGYLTNVQIIDGAREKKFLAKDGDFLQFDSTKRAVKVFKYIPHFDEKSGMQSKSMEPVNPRVVYSVYEGTELLGVGAAPFEDKIKIDEDVFISFDKVQPYSVLIVKSDPGLPLVTAGGLLLMLGVCLILLGPKNKGNEKDPSVL